MRIVITHTDFRLYWGARLRALDSALRARGDELFIVEMASEGSPYDFAADQPAWEDNRWFCLFGAANLRRLSPRRMAKALFAKLEELHPDVVLAGPMPFPPGVTAIRWSRLRGKGVVIMDDVRQVDVPRSRPVNGIKRMVYRNADAMLIPAASHAPSYEEWGVPRDRLFYGVDVVDNEWFARQAQAARRRNRDLRSRLDLPSHFFLGVGRQIEHKNWGNLIRAYADYRHLAGENPWPLLLVGDGTEREALEHQVTTRGTEGVRFVPFTARARLCELYALAGALVLPSYRETWGLVVNEAMACGLPVIVSGRCGCAAELVEEGGNGWTFDPRDSQELADRMSEFAGLPAARRAAMGARSEEIISRWPLESFAEGAIAAIDCCKNASRGFRSLFGRLLMSVWKGRYRPK